MKKGYLYIAVAVVMFTSFEVVLKFIAGQINPVQLTLCRFAIGFVLLRIVDPENRSYTVEDTAMTPFLNFVEIFSWSAVPIALVNGQGWLVVGICAVVCVAAVAINLVGKMWYKTPLAGRGGYNEQ